MYLIVFVSEVVTDEYYLPVLFLQQYAYPLPDRSQ
jgi:hypothetical protein